MPRPGKFIEIGKVAYAVSGTEKGKLCVIVDIIDQNRALVEGPFTGVRRQEYQLNRLQITKLKVKIQHSQRTKCLKQAWRDAKIDIKWNECLLAQKLRDKRLRNSLTDFDKFKVGYLKQIRNRLVKEVAKDLKRFKKPSKHLSHIERNYYLKQEAIKQAKHAAQVKIHGSEEKYKTYLKKVVPGLRKEFAAKAKVARKEGASVISEALANTGNNKEARKQALEKYALNSCGMPRFDREGKLVESQSLSEDINAAENNVEIAKERARYLTKKSKEIKEKSRIQKKLKRKRLAASKRKPWATKAK